MCSSDLQASGRSGAPTISARFRYDRCRRCGARSLVVSPRSLGGGSSCPALDQKLPAEDGCIVSPHRYALNAISDDPTMEFLGSPGKYRREIGDSLDQRVDGRLGGQEETYCCDRAPTAAVQGTDGACLTSNSDSENFWVDGRSPGRQRSSRPLLATGRECARRLLRGAPSLGDKRTNSFRRTNNI